MPKSSILASELRIGDRVGKVEIIARATAGIRPSGHKYGRFRLRCDCGFEWDSDSSIFTRGRITQCRNCKQKAAEVRDCAEYEIWKAIKQRCRNPKNKAYKNYGARGIDICDRWADSFEAFLEDVGYRPSPDLSLDRVENSKGYEPGNVEWRTYAEQSRNTRSNHWITYKNKTLCLTDWARLAGRSPAKILYWTSKGYTDQEALQIIGL